MEKTIQDELMNHFKMQQMGTINMYKTLNDTAIKGQILFTGSSLMQQFPILELMMNDGMQKIIYNRGVGGFTTDDMLENMDAQIFDVAPSKIFINIGTNDISNAELSFEDALAHTMKNYENILSQIKERLPKADVYMMAYYPVNEVDKVPNHVSGNQMFVNRNNQNLSIANEAVRNLAEKMGYHYIDVNDGLTDERGMLKPEYTVEGVHMYANGYRVVFENMKQYLI